MKVWSLGCVSAGVFIGIVLLAGQADAARGVRTGSMSGMASWYGSGVRTASGARFNANAMTAAHRSLPFGTRVQVRHRRTGRTVEVVINDRGPFVRGRVIDLSREAAIQLGITKSGVGQVDLRLVTR